MKCKIFSHDGEKYLRDEMNICLNDLNNKILSDAPDHLIFFKELVDFMIKLNSRPDNCKMGSIKCFEYDEYLNREIERFTNTYNIKENSTEYRIYDNIRNALIMYNVFGLYDLYKHREAEGWYPKIIIRRNMGQRNDIFDLGSRVEIYRGTSKKEFTSGSFSQSWTLGNDIAGQFAFTHYSGQQDYLNQTRVIIKTTISNESIYYYNKDDAEKEVIIDERIIKLCETEIIEEKIID